MDLRQFGHYLSFALLNDFMKVLFLSRYQNSVERGAEVFVSELTQRLAVNHTVEIFSDKKADSLKDVLTAKADVVIPINGRIQSLKVSLGRFIGRYKILISGHSGKGWDDIWNIAIVKPDVFVALTDEMSNWVKRWAWGNKVVKIPNGVDLNKFSPKGEKIELNLKKPIILSVGALAWYKHHELEIKAVSKLNVGSLLIVGKGEGKPVLESLGRQLLGDRFKIMDFSYQDMPKVYRSCEIFTLPSWNREAFGIAYIEALASGLGVIAPDDLQRKEIIGGGGLFTDVNDSVRYAETIKRALEIDWSQKARTQSEKFSWEKIALEYEKLILDMVG